MFKKKNWRKACKRAKTKRRKLRDQLDKLWAELVKKRAGHKCEYCDKTTYLNSHHIFSRSNLSVRWSRNNGTCLCPKHHTLGNWSAHKSPVEFIEWIRDKRGYLWYTDLRKKANQVKKWTIPELENLVEEFKEEIKD